jgi:hypothetical protein
MNPLLPVLVCHIMAVVYYTSVFYAIAKQKRLVGAYQDEWVVAAVIGMVVLAGLFWFITVPVAPLICLYIDFKTKRRKV